MKTTKKKPIVSKSVKRRLAIQKKDEPKKEEQVGELLTAPDPKPDGVDCLLTPIEVARALGYTNKRKVFEMIHDRTLKAVNLKKPEDTKNQWRVRTSELNRYISTL